MIKIIRFRCLLIMALLAVVMLFSACSRKTSAEGSLPAASADTQSNRQSAAQSTSMDSNDPKNSSSSNAQDQALMEFSSAFKTVQSNPLEDDVLRLLWLVSTSEEPLFELKVPDNSLIKRLAETYAQLVSSQGVQYTEINHFLGMDLETQYWLKAGMFKKVDLTTGEVTIYDGKSYVKFNPDDKAGTRFDPDNALVNVDINNTYKGTLATLTQSSYEQQDDQTVLGLSCCVFYMDMEFMGMKGNWLFIDKETGILVKNQYGDAKEGITIEITQFKIGGFGEEVFLVPQDITVSD